MCLFEAEGINQIIENTMSIRIICSSSTKFPQKGTVIKSMLKIVPEI